MCDDDSRRERGPDSVPSALSRLQGAGQWILALTGTLLVVSCSKVAPPETTEELTGTASPATVVTPAPAKPHTAEGAKEAAVKMYPDLAVKDSTFNKTFVDLYSEVSQKNPDFLTRADWPLILANRTAQMLFVSPATPEPRPVTVAEPPPPPPPASAPTPSTLERGAYNQKRSTSPWATPWVRHY